MTRDLGRPRAAVAHLRWWWRRWDSRSPVPTVVLVLLGATFGGVIGWAVWGMMR